MSGNRKPGILFLEALPTIAGGQTVLLNLVPALREHFRLAALLPDEGPLADALRTEGVECFFAPVGRYSLMSKSFHDVVAYALRMPLLTWRTARLVRRWGADLIYANSGPTFLWGALAAQLMGRPIIWHHHNLFADDKTLSLVRSASWLPAVRTIVCASVPAEEQLSSSLQKTTVIPNGVDTERFRPNKAARDRVRKELGINNNGHIVGMVGDLIPLKHQDTLLDAVHQLEIQPSDIHVIFVGDVRPGDAESAQYAEQLRRDAPRSVHFLGRRSDLPDILNALDLLVIASERETGPLVLLEALATGVPVLSTPVGRSTELLEARSLFPTSDSSTLAKLLDSVLGSPDRATEARFSLRRDPIPRLSLVTFQKEVLTVISSAIVPQADGTTSE